MRDKMPDLRDNTIENYRMCSIGGEKEKKIFEKKLIEEIDRFDALFKEMTSEQYISYTQFFEVWQRKSRNDHQVLTEYLSTRVWDEFDMDTEQSQLVKLVSTVLVGQDLPECNEPERKRVETLVAILTENALERQRRRLLRLAVIFVHAVDKRKLHSISYPVFRFMRNESTLPKDSYFVDHCGRHYLRENTLHGCRLLFPTDGQYVLKQSQVQLSLKDQMDVDYILKFVDGSVFTGSVLSGVALMCAAAVSGPAAPVVMAVGIGGTVASSAYNIARNAYKLLDRKIHRQSLTDQNAIMAFIEMEFSVVLSTTVAVQTVVRVAHGLSLVRLMRSLRMLIPLSGQAIVNSLLSVHLGETPERTSQLCQQLLLLTHQVVNETDKMDYARIIRGIEKVGKQKKRTLKFIRPLTFI